MDGCMINEALAFRNTLHEHNYQCLKEIGKGGFATVYLAHSLKYNIDFAIKKIAKNKVIALDNDETSAEIAALMLLNHPFIIKFFEHFNDDYFYYIVFEYCSGGSLKDIFKSGNNDYNVEETSQSNLSEPTSHIRSLSPNQFWKLVYDLLTVLMFCHDNNIAHRDIKPENIFFDKYGRIRLADFGLAHQFTDGDIISTAGSLMYMAPEVLQKKCTDPFAADIWSLGLTFLWMATGNQPYNSTPNRVELVNQVKMASIIVPPGMPEEIVLLIRQMTIYTPSRRPTARQLLNDVIPKLASKYKNIPRYGVVCGSRCDAIDDASHGSLIASLKSSDVSRSYIPKPRVISTWLSSANMKLKNKSPTEKNTTVLAFKAGIKTPQPTRSFKRSTGYKICNETFQ
ncbi:CAMK family protein kinase [Tritrichomonas foetus]|uniref:CAMK family protein kinase n=1 Tax=Tritrichomonas foetus TaxID=1144522 RepID=A0A1J4J768_9EUKA|nr:CAMK family protein kinase [Tritrichomonas foetus]|eukprot:OHS93499.1 CAMK family protein kinase [Tritrichomonas foetus]